jgi:formate hydrogenlyase transcriptional activator
VLQEPEYERVGGGCTIRVDVRVIAATNADLEQVVLQRRFRADLFYRLNVFPILIPPLRDRLDDIPLITRHLICMLSSQMNKGVCEIADEALKCLRRHTWPGNVRELQNVIERAVIRSPGPTVEISIEELRAASPETGAMRRMLAETERSHMLDVLKETNGVVSGPNGAASRLGLPRTTLASRMQKLAIVRWKIVLDIWRRCRSMKGFQHNEEMAELLPACVFGRSGGLKAPSSNSSELRRLPGRRRFRLECVGCL